MISVIILAYNRCAETLTTLEKMGVLKAQMKFEMELIVVDNASTDDTVNQVKSHFPDIRLISRKNNNGVAGWNDGFEAASYPYLLVLDDDSHVLNNLPSALAYIDSCPDVGILGFNIVDKQLRGDPLLNPDDAWKHLQQTIGFIGCGALIRKALYDKIGGFAEWLFIYTHEFEYSLRALEAGFKTIFFEKTTVVHRVSKMNRTNKRLRIYGTRNELTIIHKYFSSRRSLLLWRTWFNNLKFLKREGFKSGWYVFLGGLEFIRLRKQIKTEAVSLPVQRFYAENFWSTLPVVRPKKN